MSKNNDLQKFQQYVDGLFEDGSGQFPSVDPSTGETWALMPEAKEADVERAIQAADKALWSDEWRGMSASERGALLYKLADLLKDSTDEIAMLETRDTGKLLRETKAQVSYISEFYRYYAGLADKVEGAFLPIDKPGNEVWLRREPVGVVAAIVPWNSQLFLSAVKLGPALAAGCTIVLKGSEEGPAPLLYLAKLIHEAGFPPGVVNIITGFGSTCGAVLASHPKVARIAFTGGPETARHIMHSAGDNLATVCLELGGKSPLLIFPDADLESAVNAQIAGVFAAAGQSCVAASRLIIHNSIKDEFLERLAVRVSEFNIGDPQAGETEIGPLCTQRQRDFITDVITRSLNKGGKLVSGGNAIDRDGFYIQPTIIDCGDRDLLSFTTEMFGPVLSVRGFNTEEEAVALANDTDYGLAAGVFTKDLSRAHRLTRDLRAGVVWLNTYRAISPIVPFGGFGLSGQGREGGISSVLNYTATKAVWLRVDEGEFPDPFVMR